MFSIQIRRRLSLIAAVFVVLAAPTGAHAFVLTRIASLPVGSSVVVAADIDDDGEPDLAVASNCGISVLFANDDGTFAPPVPIDISGSPCDGPRPWLTTGDVNDDGGLDLILTRSGDPRIWVVRGHLNGSFDAPVGYATPTGEPALGVAAADLNGDGRDDLIAVERTQALFFPQDIAVLLANSSGGFDAGVRYGQSFRTAENLTVGRFDADDNVDVLAGVERCDGQCQAGIMEFAGHGDGTIGTPTVVNGIAQTAGQFVPTARGGMPTALLAAPLRGLTRDDVIVTSPGVQAFLPATDGTLAPQTPASDASGWGDVGDLDVDGALDLAMVGFNTGTLLLGTGDGDFDVELQLVSPIPFTSLQVEDANADGWDDGVLVASNGELYALLNTPTGGLDPDALDFGSVTPGTTTVARTITVFNAGVRPLKVSGASLAGAGDFRIVGNGCTGRTLTILGSCDIAVSFTPGSPGARAGTLFVASDDPLGPLEATLTGAGAPVASPGLPSAPPDRTPPSAKLSVAKQRLGDVLSRGLKVRVDCSEPCNVAATVSVSRKTARSLGLPRSALVVGRRGASLGRAGQLALTVRLAKQLRRAAKRVARLDLLVAVRTVDRAGNQAPVLRRTVRLKRR